MKKLISNPTGDNFSGTIDAYNDYARHLNTLDACVGIVGNDTAKEFFASDDKRWFKPTNKKVAVNVPVFTKSMADTLREIKSYRESRVMAATRRDFKLRWRDHVHRIEGWVSGMRDQLSIKLHFTPTEGPLESSDEHDSYFGEDKDQSDYPIKSRYSGAEVTLPITVSFIKNVLPLFNGGINPVSSSVVYERRVAKVNGETVVIRAPYLEKMGENADGRIRYQYLVLDVGDAITEIDGEPLDHKLKVRSFTAFETYGNADKKYYKQAKKFVCYMGDYIVSHRHVSNNNGEAQSITAVGDTAKKAYALARRRIAKNLMDQM